MRKILVLVFSDIRHDARVARQIDFLATDYDVSVLCFDAPENAGYSVYQIKRINLTLSQKIILSAALLARAYSFAYRLLYNNGQVHALLGDKVFDLVIANDIETLPLAFTFGPAKVLFDAHEFAPRHFEDKRVWRIFFQGFNRHLCATYIPRVDAMTTVGRGLAVEYKKYYNVNCEVITNSPAYMELSPSPVQENKIRMIHHGGANHSRKLELMIDMMEQLDDRFTLDMMLITPPVANKRTKGYIHELQERASASRNKRVRILPPLKSQEIVPFINQYDIGVFLIPPINFNYQNTLPNKFFDFIQARLAIAIGPTPEMAELVKTHKLGVVSKNFTPESLAAEISKITTIDLQTYKQNSEKAARELNADRNKKKLLEIVGKILV